MEWRTRLFCEVAAVKTQANVFSRQVKEAEDKLGALEKFRTESLEKIVAKCRGCIQTDELRLIVDEIDMAYKKIQAPFLEEKSRLLKEKESAELKAWNYAHEAYANFNTIINEVLDWQFGRGKLFFVNQSISRVFGIIEELEETYHCMGHFVSRENDVSSNDVAKITDACKNDQRPLIHVMNIGLMPLNVNEAESLCKKNVEYELLKKIIPPELIPWRMPFIFLLKRECNKESYMAPLNDGNLVFFRVDHCEFPCRKITFLGKTRRDTESILEFSMFSHAQEILDRLSEVPDGEKEVVFFNFRHHYLKAYPGITVEFM